MRKAISLEEWLKDDPKQLEWVWGYGHRQGWDLAPFRAQSRDGVLLALHGAMARREGALRKMRLAWNAYTHKVKNGRKTCSFNLSTEAAKHLTALARKQNEPLSRTLERLILESEQFREALAAAKKVEVERIEAKHARMKSDTATATQIHHLKEEIAGLKRALTDSMEQLDSTLFKNSRYIAALKAQGLLHKEREVVLDPDQEALAHVLYRRWSRATRAAIAKYPAAVKLFPVGGESLEDAEPIRQAGPIPPTSRVAAEKPVPLPNDQVPVDVRNLSDQPNASPANPKAGPTSTGHQLQQLQSGIEDLTTQISNIESNWRRNPDPRQQMKRSEMLETRNRLEEAKRSKENEYQELLITMGAAKKGENR